MPASIPVGHSSLYLGNVVDTAIMLQLNDLLNIQSQTDAANEKLNSLVELKRGFAMTMNELLNLKVDVTPLQEKISSVDAMISTAATEYINLRMENDQKLQAGKAKVASMIPSDMPESPVDFEKSKVLRLPLSFNSLKLDVQYFSYGKNSESDFTKVVASIEEAIGEATSNLGPKSTELAKAVSEQIKGQGKNHSLAGTLIITASCTHGNTAMISPLVLDPDKMVETWNALFPDPSNSINTSSPASVQNILTSGKSATTLTLLTGAAFGSSFVGMVHLLKNEATMQGDLSASITDLQNKLKLGAWLEDASGGFGVNPEIANEIKKLVSAQNIASHVNLVVMGAVPSIVSNELKMGLETITANAAKNTGEQLTSLENETDSEEETVDTAANAAKTGARIVNLQNAANSSMLETLEKIDLGASKVIDINSMLTAFENYLADIKEKDNASGVPIQFFLKKINRQQVAKLWLDKYYPRQTTTEPPPATEK